MKTAIIARVTAVETTLALHPTLGMFFTQSFKLELLNKRKTVKFCTLSTY